jgi:Flp pilus assembly protein TadG
MVAAALKRLTLPLRFLRDRGAVAAVEFALIVPMMILIYLGGNEIGNALTVLRKVTHGTNALADLVTQSKSVSSSDITQIMNAVGAVLYPYQTSHLRARVSVVAIDSSGVAKVSWSSASNFTQTSPFPTKEPQITALTAGSVVTLPASVRTNSTYLVMAEVHYYYTPPIGYVLSGTIDLKDTFYLRPRFSDTITGP